MKSIFIIVLLAALEAGGTILIPDARKYFYDVLSNKNIELFSLAIGYLILLSFGLDLVVSFKKWAVSRISFRYRETKYKRLRSLWIKTHKATENFTTAMTTALSLSTESYLTVTIEMIISSIIIVVLISQYWHMKLILALSIGYTIAVCLIAYVFNRPLITSDKNNQEAEGAHREAITVLEGLVRLDDKWYDVVGSALRKFRINFYFTLFTRFKGSIATILGLIILAPQYFAGEITLGDFMAIVSVFELIVGNTTYIINLYPIYTAAKASSAITKQFEETL